MMRRTWAGLMVFTVACAGTLAVACGDDDSSGHETSDAGDGHGSGGRSSGGRTGSGGESTGGAGTGGTAGDGGGAATGGEDGGVEPDGGPSDCTFASYVIGLVNDSTNASALPDTTLGANCAESTSQSEFATLFR